MPGRNGHPTSTVRASDHEDVAALGESSHRPSALQLADQAPVRSICDELGIRPESVRWALASHDDYRSSVAVLRYHAIGGPLSAGHPTAE